MFTKHSLQTRYVYKTKTYQMFTKQKFTNTLCLQNKTESLQTRYVYKTRQNKCLQNKGFQTHYVYKTKQYKTENVHTSYVYKTKQYKTKRLQNTLC